MGSWAGWAKAHCELGRLCCAMRLHAPREELLRTWTNWQVRVSGSHADGGGLKPATSLHSWAAEPFYSRALLGITLWREALRKSDWRRRGLLKGWRGYVKVSSRAMGYAWQAWLTWCRARLIRQTRLSRWRLRHCTLVCWVVCQWELITACHRKSVIKELRRVRRQDATKIVLMEWASVVLLLRRRRIIGLSLTRQHLFWQVSTAYSAWANATEHGSEAYCEAAGTMQNGIDQILPENLPLSISCSPLKLSDSNGGVDHFVNFGGNHGHDPERFDFNHFRDKGASLLNRDAADPGKADWLFSGHDVLSARSRNHRVQAFDPSRVVSPRPDGDRNTFFHQIHWFEESFQQVTPMEHLKVFSPVLECCAVGSAVEYMFHNMCVVGIVLN